MFSGFNNQIYKGVCNTCLHSLNLRFVVVLSQDSSPNNQRIVLIETPATPIPPEVPDDLTTTIVQLPVTSSSSKQTLNGNETSPSKEMETTTGNPAVEIKTQDRSKKKSSLGPSGSWLLNNQSESTKDDNNPEKNTPRKDSKGSRKTKENNKNNETNAPRKDSKDSRKTVSTTGEKDKKSKNISLGSGSGSGLLDKAETIGDNNTPPPSTNNSIEASREASLTNVAVSVNHKTESPAKNSESDKAFNEADDGKDGKQEKGNTSGTNGENGTAQVSKDVENNKENDEAMSEKTKEETENKNEETKAKKKSVHKKISSWLFGDKEDEDINTNVMDQDKKESKIDEKDNKENKGGNSDHGKTSDVKASEGITSNSLANETNDVTNPSDGGDRNSFPVDGNDNVIGKEVEANDDKFYANNGNVKDEAPKEENTTQEVKEQEQDTYEDEDGRNMEMIDEEGEDDDDDDDDDFGDDFGDDDDGEDDDDDDGEAPDKNGEKSAGTSTGTRRRGSRKLRGRRKTLRFGKIKWNAQSKVDTGSSSYKPKASVKKIPHFKNDYSHVKSRVSSLSEASTIDKAVESQPTQRQRSVSFNKSPLPDYSNVRPRLYNGTTRRYNSDMPSTVQK